jgi:hypothetical protein
LTAFSRFLTTNCAIFVPRPVYDIMISLRKQQLCSKMFQEFFKTFRHWRHQPKSTSASRMVSVTLLPGAALLTSES